MSVASFQLGVSFFTTDHAFSSDRVPTQDRRANEDPGVRAFFEECWESGRPCIEHHAASGSFGYVYFDRSTTPPPDLIAALDDLACEFGLVHLHVLRGGLFRDRYGDDEDIPYQGRFLSPSGTSWPPERVESFVMRLHEVLPHFDRRAVIEGLTQEALDQGYFYPFCGMPHGDRSIEESVNWEYVWRCEELGQPWIAVSRFWDSIEYRPAQPLTPEALTAIRTLAATFGLVPAGDSADEASFEPVELASWRSLDYEGFARGLRAILTNSRSQTTSI